MPFHLDISIFSFYRYLFTKYILNVKNKSCFEGYSRLQNIVKFH